MVYTSAEITGVGRPPCLSGCFFSKSNDVSSVGYNIVDGFGVFTAGSSALGSRLAPPNPFVRFVGLVALVALQSNLMAVVL